MQGGSQPKGFTIIETLIVLAITGALFVMAATFINNRQNRTQFSQGVRDVESRLQQVISDVSTGYYPNNGEFECTAQADGPRIRRGSAEQGTNEACVFLGKVIQFAVDSDDSPVLHVYSLVGLRQNGSELVNSLSEARPRLVAGGTSDPAGLNAVPDVYEKVQLPYGLTVNSLTYDNTKSIGAIGFVSRLGAALGEEDTSQQVDLLAFPNTSTGQSKLLAVDRIKTSARGQIASQAAETNPTGGVQLCLKSGGTIQSALISIGTKGRQLAVSVSVRNTDDCR